MNLLILRNLQEMKMKNMFCSFHIKVVTQNILSDAKQKKIAKYEPIVMEAKEWLESTIDAIRIKHKVSNVNVKVEFVIISNLGVVPKETERDVCDIVNSDKKERLRLECMWTKRMVNQAIRGSFECYLNVDKEVSRLDHIAE
jgi:hypothetical protein